MSLTDDEKLLIALYERWQETQQLPVNPYAIGDQIGMSTRKVRTILVLLMRANFVVKADEEHCTLTSRAVALAEQLLEE